MDSCWEITMKIFTSFFKSVCALAACFFILGMKPKDINIEQALHGFEPFVETVMKDWEVPGLAVAIVKDNKVVYTKGFGYRDVEKKLPVTSDTLFAIGSCTKAFTATALGMLVDEKKLDWDKPVKNYVPNFKMYDDYVTKHVSTRDLLLHRTGLPRHDLLWEFDLIRTREEFLKILPDLKPATGFREDLLYNNIMYAMAAHVAENITQTTWEGIVEDRILEPLGMERSNFSVITSQQDQNYALPYKFKDKKLERIPFFNFGDNGEGVGPAGSINSSVIEMAEWIKLNLNKGKRGDKQLVSKETLQEIHKPQMIVDGDIGYGELFFESYALGWEVSAYRGYHRITHGGSTDGFVATVSMLDAQGIGVVLLANEHNVDRALYVVLFNIFDRLLGLDQIDWNGRLKELAFEDETEELKNSIPPVEPDEKRFRNYFSDKYTGTFSHPAYGTIEVMFDGALKMRWGSLQATLKNLKEDVFETSENIVFGEPHEYDEEMELTFKRDESGFITSFVMPVYVGPGEQSIEFSRF